MDQKKLNEYNFSAINADKAATSATQAIKGKIKTIDEEINFLTELSMLVQEKNEKYKTIIEEKIKKKKDIKLLMRNLNMILIIQKAII